MTLIDLKAGFHRLAIASLLAVMSILLLAGQPERALAQTAIVATVNDEPISDFDVDQRAKFYALTSGRKASPNSFKKRSLDELVEEALMNQEMRRLSVTVPDDQVIASINSRLASGKRNYKWFKGMLRSRGIRIATLENRIRAQLGWRTVIQRTYAGLINIGESAIDQAIEEIDATDTKADTVFSLKKVILALPAGADDAAVARRLEEASKIRRAFRDCRTASLVTGRFRDVKSADLRGAKASELAEPTRSLVLQAKANDMIPPTVTDKGIELIAVCERNDDGGKRDTAQRQLVSQEFGMLADRHLRDLKQDAVVDYR